MINCEIELDLLWSEDAGISKILITPEVPANPAVNPPTNRVLPTRKTGATFQINSTKFYIPETTLSINDSITFLENTKQGYKEATSWNKYRSEVVTQLKNNNLDYMIGPTFRNINTLFVLSFKLSRNMATRNTLNRQYLPLVEIKDFKVLIDNKPFLINP